MSNSDTGEGCISEVTLAISKARGSHNQAGARRILDSPDSDESGRSQSFTVQSYDYTDNGSPNNNLGLPDGVSTPVTPDDLRIPIVGYEVMEERARFTVYKLRVELKNGDCWFVFRRYTDFVRLLSQLRRQKLPIAHLSLPRKKWIGDNFAPSFLEERIRGLQVFVNNLLGTAVLISNKSVREFFCLDEPPALSDTAEEARAIFEALEDTIYHLRQQLRERDAALAAERNISNELRNKLHRIMTEKQQCSKCGALDNL
ncbi:sorting nexin-16 [Diachasma alloeum]|uniref:sorting nexin-16 n=1 Tax=Diachasma alloeum TaxID=454923 RepID=UPI00073826FC|nr:sorting nexin-16 [Diachasma alloeum]XP_015125135.1 sorting nexin-16 [Diachasma alloeum]